MVMVSSIGMLLTSKSKLSTSKIETIRILTTTVFNNFFGKGRKNVSEKINLLSINYTWKFKTLQFYT